MEGHSRNREKLVLVLQGGGAMGAYQAGAYEALAEAGAAPEWVAGISIGAINSAIIAGNPHKRRVERLRQFWIWVSSRLILQSGCRATMSRAKYSTRRARRSWPSIGVPGFFEPRVPPAVSCRLGRSKRSAFTTRHRFKATLQELVDFDQLNSGKVRLQRRRRAGLRPET